MANDDFLNDFTLDRPTTEQGAQPEGGIAPKKPKGSEDFLNSFTLDEPSMVAAKRESEERAAKQKEYKPATAADVAKSLGSGLEIGGAQMAGFPGDVARAGRWLGEEGKYYGTKAAEHYGYVPEGTAEENWKSVEEARKSPDRDWVGPLPTSEVTTKWAKEHLPGATYEPESRAGAFAHTVGEFAPTVIGGEGSLAKRLGVAAISGLGSEAAGQLTEGTGLEPVARIAGAVASPFAAEKALSRPLGSLGSALGVSDEALGSVGLKSGTMVANEKLAAEARKLKDLGMFSGWTEDEIKKIWADEAANGIPLSESKVNKALVLSNNLTDLIKSSIKSSSLEDPRVREQIQRLFAERNQLAESADTVASRMLGDMHDEAAVNAINEQRQARGIPDLITEPPSADELRKVANEVRQGAWEREVQPVYDTHNSVDSPTLKTMLPIADSRVVGQVQADFNRLRQARGLQPYDFLSKNANDQWEAVGTGSYTLPFWNQVAAKNQIGGGNGITKGAPLEFWDMLAGQLQGTQNKADQVIGQQIREGIDQYFASRGLPNELKIAKDSFRGIRGEGDAVTAGMRFIESGRYQTNPASRQAFLKSWNKLTDTEKGLYQAGVLQQIYSTISQGTKGFSDWRKILQNKDNRQLLQEVLNFRSPGAAARDGISNFDRFESSLKVADSFRKEDVSRLLSNTNESRSLLGRLMAPIGTDGRSIGGILLNSAERAYLFGTPFGAITIFNGGLGYIRQVMADKEARHMLNMFASKDPEQILALTREIASNKKYQTSWQKVQSLLDFSNKSTINFYRRAAIAANNQPQGRKAGGRVGYGPGGEVSDDDTTPDYSNRKIDNLGFYSRAGEALRSFPKQEEQQPVGRILKTLLEKHDVHPDEFRYTGLTKPESTGKDLQLADEWNEKTTSPMTLAEMIEANQPQMQRTRLTGNDVEYRTHKVDHPALSDYTEDVYHFPTRDIPETHKWQADTSKWTVRHDPDSPWPHGVYDENNVFMGSTDQGSMFHPDTRESDVIKLIHDQEKERREYKTKRGLNFEEPHFGKSGLDKANKSGWIRHSIATLPPSEDSPNGLKFLNIEEVQPERAQKAESKGLITELYNPNERDNLTKEKNKAWEIYKNRNATREERNEAFLRFDEIQNKINELDNNYWSKTGGKFIGDAPYANSVEASTRRYARQILSDAAQNGLNGVTITPWFHHAVRAGAIPLDNIIFKGMTSPDGDKANLLVTKMNEGSFANPMHVMEVRNPSKLSEEELEELNSNFGKQTAKKLIGELQNWWKEKYRPEKQILAEHEDEPLLYTHGNGQVIDGNRYFYKEYLPRVLEKEAKRIDPSMKIKNIFKVSDRRGRMAGYHASHRGLFFSKKFANLAKKGGFRSFKQGGEVDDDSVLSSVTPIEMPRSLSELQNWNKKSSAPAKAPSMDETFSGRVSGVEGAPPIAMPTSLAELQKFKRPTRATGGRIPEVDKLFKSAKKSLDGDTKSMLHLPDDVIVNALRIAQGRV